MTSNTKDTETKQSEQSDHLDKGAKTKVPGVPVFVIDRWIDEGSKIRIVNHWIDDAGDSEIVLIEPVDKSIKLRNDLFLFNGDQMPRWSNGTELTFNQIRERRCSKWGSLMSVADLMALLIE